MYCISQYNSNRSIKTAFLAAITKEVRDYGATEMGIVQRASKGRGHYVFDDPLPVTCSSTKRSAPRYLGFDC